MASVGPQMPPSLSAKRKRKGQEDREDSNGSSSDSDTGPAPPPQPKESTPKKPRVIGPSLPPPSQTKASASASERGSESSDSDDDDFGPSLPCSNTGASSSSKISLPAGPQSASAPAPVASSKRDDWMIVPPSGGDWTARVDPTKLRNRKFNTGKSAKGPSSSGRDATDSWHETPQEKQARLQREMMGIRDTSAKPAPDTISSVGKVDAETAKRLAEYNKSRGPTLYDAHQQDSKSEKDDDPSARAFDREKDIGGGLQINATQRRDMMKKAADFGSKFSSARYL